MKYWIKIQDCRFALKDIWKKRFYDRRNKRVLLHCVYAIDEKVVFSEECYYEYNIPIFYDNPFCIACVNCYRCPFLKLAYDMLGGGNCFDIFYEYDVEWNVMDISFKVFWLDIRDDLVKIIEEDF